jgi:dinuclear metal center YbgI/SA1388 family protein
MSGATDASRDVTTLADVLGRLQTTSPLAWAEDWDRVGLVVGDRSQPVRRVLVALEPTLAVVREAVAADADLLVTHHPLLLRGVSFLPTDTGKGAVVTELIRGGVALWCGHTNVDRSAEGTVGAWLRALDLRDARALDTTDADANVDVTTLDDRGAGSSPSPLGPGLVGTLPEPTTVRGLAQRIAGFVPETVQGIRFTGDPERPVHRVAVCPGAGDSFLYLAATSGADAYVTSDLRHHPALEHMESRADPLRVPALVDVPHWASESLWLPLVETLLSGELPELTVTTSSLRTDPWSGSVGGHPIL